MKEKVKEMTHEDNLAVWQKGLLAEKGVSLKEIMKQCNCDKRTADQDLLIIKSLIATTGARIESEGIMTKRYRLSQEVNVLALYAQSKVAVPYRDLMNLLTRSRGLLSTGFFTEISSVYDEIMSTTNTDDKPIEFESNINESVAMPYFTEIFKALRKEALLVTRHHSTNPNKSEDVILHPEYLKEYNSEWYVFGNISEETEGKPVCGRIPLSMIDNITSPATPVAFIPTGKTSADYFSMLSEVIGVEVDPNCKREVIQLRVSTRMFHRIHNNPIHSSQKDAPSLDVPGYKGLTIEVRRNKELMRTLLNMGSDVEVVSPKHIRNSVKKELAKNMKLYQEV